MSFCSDQSPSENLRTSEFKNIVIQRADKGNTIVMQDKIDHINAIEEILNDHIKFSNLDIPAGK